MDSARTRKPRQAKNLPKSEDTHEFAQPIAVTPLIVEQGLYSSEQIIAALAISDKTLCDWMKQGLKPLGRNDFIKTQTKRRYFHGRKVIEFMAGPPSSNSIQAGDNQ